MNTMTREEWLALGKKLYGEDFKQWKFKCVHCGNIQTAQDFKDIGVDPDDVVFFSCLGRWKKGIGCDWTLGGVFRIHKREVTYEEKSIPVFLFADEPEPAEVKT